MYTSMKKSGADLRRAIMSAKGESSGECCGEWNISC